MRRTVLAVVTALACFGGSIAIASVSGLDGPARVDRVAHRLAPPSRLSVDPTDRAAGDMIELVNLERSRRGLPDLQVHELVSAAAIAHSVDMAARGSVGHRGTDGSDAGDRLDREGYVWRRWGETIGADYTTPEQMFDAWMERDSHRVYLLSRNTYVGIGVASSSDGVPYWTLVVAT